MVATVVSPQVVEDPRPKTFDEYRKDHVDGKIKDNHGDPRNGGGKNEPDAKVDKEGNGAKLEAAPVALEFFGDKDYETIRGYMEGVSENIAPGYNNTLRDVAQQIIRGMSDLKVRVETLESERGWRGKTHDAAMANLLTSYEVPEELGKGAVSLGMLSEYFSQTMSTNKHNILDQWETYQACLRAYPNETDTVKQYFNVFAREVMTNFYSKQIMDIANNHPAIGVAQTPDVGGAVGGGGHHDARRDNALSSRGYRSAIDARKADDGRYSGPPATTDDTAQQSFSPPPPPQTKTPNLAGESGGDSGAGAGDASPSPRGTPPAMPSLGAQTPQLPGLPSIDGPSDAGRPDTGGKFDPSKVLTDPQSIAAADKLFNDPKTADAAKKLFGDPKLADAARTLFGKDAKGLLGDPKALDAAKTLFGDPEAADAVETLFGDPETAKAAQKLLNDPQLSDLSTVLNDSGALRATGLPEVTPVEAVEVEDSAGSLLGPSALSPSDINNAAGLPGVAAGGSSVGGGLLGDIFDGVNQIVQTAMQGATQPPPEFNGGTGTHGGQAALGNNPGTGAGSGGAAAAGVGAGKPQLPSFGVPAAAAGFTPVAHMGALQPDTAPGQPGYPAGSPPPGGGQGGGGRGGEGKDHKGNKALRSEGHGNDIIGQKDAVVSVIGQDGDDWDQDWNVSP